MIPFFSFSTSPFSRKKLAFYLLGMVAITAVALLPAVYYDAERVPPMQGGAAGVVSDLLRFGKPSDEVLERLPEIGIPWFLRRAGVTGQTSASRASQLVTTLTWDGKTVGRYVETVQPIDEDRTRLYLAFEPGDMEALRRLAAPIDTALDPTSLLRVVMAEHTRSGIEGGSFNLYVLTQGGYRSRLNAATSALRGERDRISDDFPLSSSDESMAAIRRAYRNEAQRAGAAAPGL